MNIVGVTGSKAAGVHGTMTFPYGLVVSVVVGIILGVIIGTSLLVLVLACRKRYGNLYVSLCTVYVFTSC